MSPGEFTIVIIFDLDAGLIMFFLVSTVEQRISKVIFGIGITLRAWPNYLI